MRSLRPFLILALAASTPALAATYPGLMCHKDGSTGSIDVDGNGHVQNLSQSAELVVECPVVANDPQEPPLDLEVYVTDQTSSGEVCCEWRAKSPGSSFTPGTRDCTGVQFNNWDWERLDPGFGIPPTSNGTRYLRCTLPADTATADPSEIRSYNWIEFITP